MEHVHLPGSIHPLFILRSSSVHPIFSLYSTSFLPLFNLYAAVCIPNSCLSCLFLFYFLSVFAQHCFLTTPSLCRQSRSAVTGCKLWLILSIHPLSILYASSVRPLFILYSSSIHPLFILYSSSIIRPDRCLVATLRMVLARDE
jgi:hypothetical protein